MDNAANWASVGMSAVALIGTIIANVIGFRKSINEANNAVKLKEIEANHSVEMTRITMQLEFCQREHTEEREARQRLEKKLEALEAAQRGAK